eukprot:IDg13831t1
MNPRNVNSRARYVARIGNNDKGECIYDTKPVKKQFKGLSRVIQKLGISMQLVYNSDPKGLVTRTQVHAMACAIHSGTQVRWSTASCTALHASSGLSTVVSSCCKTQPSFPSRLRVIRFTWIGRKWKSVEGGQDGGAEAAETKLARRTQVLSEVLQLGRGAKSVGTGGNGEKAEELKAVGESAAANRPY